MSILNRKKPNADLRNYYNLYLQFGLIVALLVLLVAFNVHFAPSNNKSFSEPEQETVKMEQVVQTKQQEKPPPPPRPPVPVEVPNDAVINDSPVDLNAELDLNAPLNLPPPPPPASTEKKKENDQQVFVVVEKMPQLIGGLAKLQASITYPELARKAGIEGRVYVEFVVDEHGRVENPRVVRGIGGGCDEAAIEAVKKARFVPGMQRGRPVKVRYSLPIVFKLQN
ncbi:MAG TPA: energy transducer TonB [Balneolales bacterium]|nr:energy transducer TonB [Balneolales bacterium]